MSEAYVPMHYQPRMEDWLVEKKHAALFCSPGLGKTVVTLKAIDQLMLDGEIKGVLVVAPLRVSLITWPQQVARWQHSSWMKVANMRTEEGARMWEEGSADIYLINYEMLASREANVKCRKCKGEGCGECKGLGTKKQKSKGFVERFIKGRKTIPVDMIVWDEISLAKDPSGKRVNSLKVYNDFFKRRVGLTGTPVANNYLDLFAQIRLLDDGARLGRTFSSYRDIYFESDYMGYKFTLREGAKKKIDSKIADLALVMLGEDYLDVPTCTTEDIAVTLPPDASKLYRKMEKELLLELEKGDVVALNAAVLAGKLLQITGGAVYDENKNVQVVHDAKLKALRKLREKHKTEALLVLVAYRHEMDRVLAEFPEAVKFHEKLIPDWQQGKIPMMVCQPQSMSHGIDGLQLGGRIAIWHTLTWSNETYLQTNARIVRTGQKSESIVYRLIVSDTYDDVVCEALRAKSNEQSGLMQALKALQLMRS